MSGQQAQLPSADDGSEFAYDGASGGNPAPRVTIRDGKAQSSTSRAAAEQRDRLAVRAPASRVKLPAFRSLVPMGVTVSYTENKVSIMPRLDDIVMLIASEMGVSMDDAEESTAFLYALVTDVYVNPYSDKYTFEGDIEIAGKLFPRRHIKSVLFPVVGTHFRRYARAMSATVVRLIEGNSDFNEIVDKRALELNISRADAVYSFDGADALIEVNRDTNSRNAAARTLALAKRDTGAGYLLSTSAAASGAHGYTGNSSGAGSDAVGFTHDL